MPASEDRECSRSTGEAHGSYGARARTLVWKGIMCPYHSIYLLFDFANPSKRNETPYQSVIIFVFRHKIYVYIDQYQILPEMGWYNNPPIGG